jgi:hypothetical protein
MMSKSKSIKNELPELTEWLNEQGLYHRDDGPAIEWSDGSREWYVNGKNHRLDGPAVEWSDGGREWWVDGKCHRLDGPAIEKSDGRINWWVNDTEIRIY